MQAIFAEVELLFDATKRPYQRTLPAVDRPADYSGKKRMTHKNTLIANPSCYTNYLGPTTNGTTYNHQILEKGFDTNLGLLDWWRVLADLGLVSDYGLTSEKLSYRKPWCSKKKPGTVLTATQRADNQSHAHRRVKVEHAVSSDKCLGCVTQVYRNKPATFND